MIAPVFVDINILIYALDYAELKTQSGQALAGGAVEEPGGRTSFQALPEFYVKMSQKVPDAHDQARAEVRDLLAWRPVVIDDVVLNLGWKLQDRYQLSFWDALIVAAAKSIPCRFLLTEDLHAGQDLDGVLVVNPFVCDPASLPRR